MGTPTSNHRPLRAGIAIMPSDGPSQRPTANAICKNCHQGVDKRRKAVLLLSTNQLSNPQAARQKGKAAMQTHNRYMHIIAIVIAAACLSLATACGGDDTEYAHGDIITPSAPCGPDIPLTPSIEYTTLEGAKVPPEYEDFLYAAKNPYMIGIKDPEDREVFMHNVRVIARAERLQPEIERIHGILDKYRDRIRRQYVSDKGGHVHGYAVTGIENETGELTDKLVIEVDVIEYVDQSTLPPEDRIPECMEGVEVHFRVSTISTIDY